MLASRGPGLVPTSGSSGPLAFSGTRSHNAHPFTWQIRTDIIDKWLTIKQCKTFEKCESSDVKGSRSFLRPFPLSITLFCLSFSSVNINHTLCSQRLTGKGSQDFLNGGSGELMEVQLCVSLTFASNSVLHQTLLPCWDPSLPWSQTSSTFGSPFSYKSFTELCVLLSCT